MSPEGSAKAAAPRKEGSGSAAKDTAFTERLRETAGRVSGIRRVCFLDETDSTNEWAKREAADGAPGGSVYFADAQTAGRGSRGRSWESPAGTSLYFSLLLDMELPAEKMYLLTPVMGMAACGAVRRQAGPSAMIKWPNDVVMNGRKVCGILTEWEPRAGKVIIGVGINVNRDSFPPELRERATSLLLETGRECDRAEIAGDVLALFFDGCGKLLSAGDLGPLLAQYNDLLINRGRRVRTENAGETVAGVARGVDADGALLVLCDDGRTERLIAGEVSVRGVYGYV